MHHPSKGPQTGRGLRAAIYTRKSTEEGLEQDFNSLDAQHEACAAYIASQRHEGWRLAPARYDDGGFSGGSMDRPGLTRLLADVRAAQIDIVVVYKVDRLTRALADFAKIVEIFDAHGVSFVSVTQAFNTTTSMGRLTLNVLLSFAQFEREVTAERIRDKIAASKKKGMWMGGAVPLGYDAADRKLVVNAAEAATVREIYRRYIALGSVKELAADLAQRGIVSKRRVDRHGCAKGGSFLSRGAIYWILKSPIYNGEIAHKGMRYPGRHDAIVDQVTWERVQAHLAENRRNGDRHPGTARESFLTGRLFGPGGQRMVANHAVKRLRGANQGARKHYRYYAWTVSGREARSSPVLRVPASDLERSVLLLLAGAMRDEAALLPALQARFDDAAGLDNALQALARDGRALDEAVAAKGEGSNGLALGRRLCAAIRRVELDANRLSVTLCAIGLLEHVGVELAEDKAPAAGTADPGAEIVYSQPFQLPMNGRPARLLIGQSKAAQCRRDPRLIALIANARRWASMLLTEPDLSIDDITTREGLGKGQVSRLLPLAFLAPGVAEAILDGKQSEALTVAELKGLVGLPLDWDDQRCLLLEGG